MEYRFHLMHQIHDCRRLRDRSSAAAYRESWRVRLHCTRNHAKGQRESTSAYSKFEEPP
jgi:hypothetical protein